MSKLDSYEKEIFEAFESGNLKSLNLKNNKLNGILQLQRQHLKDARINIRLSSRDLRSLQAKALKEGMPYQTLVSSVLHKFIDGQHIDKPAKLIDANRPS